MGRGQPTSRNGGATPASSLIIFLEQRVAELETQRDEAEQFASNMENWITRAEAAEAKVAELERELSTEIARVDYLLANVSSWWPTRESLDNDIQNGRTDV